MELPIQAAPKFTTTLPISQQEVSYRPFLVKEQRNLLLAKESDSQKEIFKALEGIVTSVSDGSVNVKELTTTDIEYLFLQIRTKSVGETASVTFQCVEDECDGEIPSKLNLLDVEVVGNYKAEDRVQLTEELFVDLKYPTAQQLIEITDTKDEELQNKKMMRMSMRRIIDSENVYELDEYPDSEIDKFVDSLTVEQFSKITKFYEDVPTLSLTTKTVCPKCKDERVREVKGLQNFF